MIHHKDTKNTKERANYLSNKIIGASIEVHRTLGPGLLESAYEECLCRELFKKNIPFSRQFPLALQYKGIRLDCGYRLDLLVDDLVIVELKAIDRLEQNHHAQILTYLRLKKLWLGLLINFNVVVLRNGIKRIVNG